MNDPSCIQFLQWSLPRLRYRWRGFKKVRRQVCRRIEGRFRVLGLADVAGYRNYLLDHAEEWQRLDACCDISVTHFYRDRYLFDAVARTVLPTLAREAQQAGRNRLQVWSLGCCSGEEPYTLSLIWQLAVHPTLDFPCDMTILATDRNSLFLKRARDGRYGRSSLKDLPTDYITRGFETDGGHYRLKDPYRACVQFSRQDIRDEYPTSMFDLIGCRNLVLTYFQSDLQQRVLEQICARLNPGGYLMTGAHEKLPPGNWPLVPDPDTPALYRKPCV